MYFGNSEKLKKEGGPTPRSLKAGDVYFGNSEKRKKEGGPKQGRRNNAKGTYYEIN